MNAWAAVVLAGIGSFAFRFGTASMVDRIALPAWFERTSAHVMPACFAGLATIALLGARDGGLVAATPLLTGATTTITIARRKAAHVAMLSGLVVLWMTSLALGHPA